MIKILIGNIFESRCQTLVNTVNCVGIMGKGIAQIFKKEHPAMFEDYKARCERGEVRLGEPYLYTDLSGVSIINFPTKQHWRSGSRLEDIEKGLDRFRDRYREWGILSVAFPPLGCGNGGLEWEEVGPLMYEKLSDLPIEVEVYAPYGTPAGQTKKEFLERQRQRSLALSGQSASRMNPSWFALLEVIHRLEEQPYAKPVGRVVFQKLCYIFTELGVDTGFQFRRESYGPFSEDVKKAIGILANKNLLQEEQLGRMMALRVGPEFKANRQMFQPVLQKQEKKIDKTVDLFSRIKDTEQAEEVVTVLYTARELKKTRNPDEVSEKDVSDSILEWKKSWRTDQKSRSVAETIRNLEMLSWLRLKQSEEFSEPQTTP